MIARILNIARSAFVYGRISSCESDHHLETLSVWFYWKELSIIENVKTIRMINCFNVSKYGPKKCRTNVSKKDCLVAYHDLLHFETIKEKWLRTRQRNYCQTILRNSNFFYLNIYLITFDSPRSMDKISRCFSKENSLYIFVTKKKSLI